MNCRMTFRVTRKSQLFRCLAGYVVMLALLCVHSAYAGEELEKDLKMQKVNEGASPTNFAFMSAGLSESIGKHDAIFTFRIPRISIGDLKALLGRKDFNDINTVDDYLGPETYVLHHKGMVWFLTVMDSVRKDILPLGYPFPDDSEIVSVKAVAYSHAEEKAPSTDSGVQDVNEDPLTTESTDPTDILIERMGKDGFVQVWDRHMSVRDLKVLLEKENLRDAELIHDFTSKRTYLLMEGGMMWLLTVRPESPQPSGNRRSYLHPLDDPNQGVSTKVIVFPATQKGANAPMPRKAPSQPKEPQNQE